MKLFDTLKQFKNIEPDAGYAQRSRTKILLSPQTAQKTMRGVFVFLHMIETGVTVVLAGFFILILTGSFSSMRSSIAPIQYSVMDPAGLYAEAQAINMQIQLTDINYPQTTSSAESTVASTIVKNSLSKALGSSAATAPLGATSTASSTPAAITATSTPSSTSPLSVDQALQQLAK